jgi:hypothetical protein
MQINRIVQTLLFALVIIGIFAAMAKNAYGFTFMGVACFGLAVLYMIQLSWKLITDYSSLAKRDVVGLFELLLLSILLALFGFRAFYIYLPNGELIFIGTSILLVLVYLLTAFESFSTIKKESQSLAWNLIFFYTSVILFILSMVTIVMMKLSLSLGVLAMVVALPCMVSLVRQKKYENSGKSISLFRYVVASKTKTGLLFLFFISSAVYTGLSQYGIIPEIENSAQPKAYIELINDAESGKEKQVDGKYRHEKYKASMDKFLERHSSKK